MKINGNDVPNPGSDEAIEQGCICPVLDNARGTGAYGGGVRGEDGKLLFWINENCPIHGKRDLKCYKETTNEN